MAAICLGLNELMFCLSHCSDDALSCFFALRYNSTPLYYIMIECIRKRFHFINLINKMLQHMIFMKSQYHKIEAK